MDLNEKIAARRKELAMADGQQSIGADERIEKAIKDPETKSATQDTEALNRVSISEKKKDEDFNRTLTQRIKCNRSEADIKVVVGNHFHKMEPEFDPSSLRYENTAKVTIDYVADSEWLITVDFKEEDESKLRYSNFVLGAIFLYNLFAGNLGFAFIVIILVFAVGILNRKFPDKFTSANVRARLMNINDELHGT